MIKYYSSLILIELFFLLAGSCQVIGLLDVFTPEISLDRFRDL